MKQIIFRVMFVGILFTTIFGYGMSAEYKMVAEDKHDSAQMEIKGSSEVCAAKVFKAAVVSQWENPCHRKSTPQPIDQARDVAKVRVQFIDQFSIPSHMDWF